MNEQDNVMRLAKPKRKGILSLIFSRFFFIAVLLVLEVLVLLTPLIFLRDYLPHFVAVLGVFVIVMMVYLFNCKMDSTAKLTWMFIIAILPVSGAAMLAFTQLNLGHRAVQKRATELIGAVTASVYLYLLPVVSVIGAAVILGEPVDAVTFAAIAVILIGLVFSQKGNRPAETDP